MKDRDARPPTVVDYLGGLIFGSIVLVMILFGRLVQILLLPIWLPFWLVARMRKPRLKFSGGAA